jgi:hypothetical protein
MTVVLASATVAVLSTSTELVGCKTRYRPIPRAAINSTDLLIRFIRDSKTVKV